MAGERYSKAEIDAMRRELEHKAGRLDELGDHRNATPLFNAANSGSRRKVIRAYNEMRQEEREDRNPTQPSSGGNSPDYRVERSSAITGIALAGALGAGLLGLVQEARAATPVTPDVLKSPKGIETTVRPTLPQKGLLVDFSQAAQPLMPRVVNPQIKRR